MWGGCDDKEELLNTIRVVNLSSGQATALHIILPCGMTHFAAFIVNIPKVFVAEGKNSKYWYSYVDSSAVFLLKYHKLLKH